MPSNVMSMLELGIQQPDNSRAMTQTQKVNANVARLGLSPRQQELNRLWSYYRCAQYEARSVEWDGSRAMSALDKEVVATSGVMPPGFVDAGEQGVPIKFRKPTVKYHLSKVVTDRFTGLLFSEKNHPQMRVEGDAQTEDWVSALIEECRLWAQMVLARQYGGAMGSVAVGFKFVDGKPVVEVHDPRWMFPEFESHDALKLKSVEKRYQYPTEVRDPVTGEWVTVHLWYRRVINERLDVVFKPVPVAEDGSEPLWEVDEGVEHGLGFCPVVWVQNAPVQDSCDGDPDCHGIHDLVEAIDALLSMANQGVIGNCDPTVIISSPDKLGEVRKGSDNVVKLTGGTAQYMELSGSGPKSAVELADRFRALGLEVAQCVLEHPEVAGRTATEIERVYSSMIGKADVLREQYGERGVKALVEMMLRAARKLAEPSDDGEGGVEVGAVTLPPRVETDEETGETTLVERKLGKGGRVTLQWPGYFHPGLSDAKEAVSAAVSAVSGGLIDDATAVKFTAPYFGVGDAGALLRQVREAAKQRELEYMQQMMQQTGQAASTPELGQPPTQHEPEPGQELPVEGAEPTEMEPMPEEPEKESAPAGMGGDTVLGAYDMEALKAAQFFQYEIEGGIVTINEVRASKGLPPKKDGHLTLPEYRAKFATTYAISAASQSPTVATNALREGLASDTVSETPGR